MALNSPGVEVQVINESFYVPAQPATRPLIVFASAQNKPNGSGTGVAQGTLSTNVGIPKLVSSQRELTELFGTPKFYQDSSQNPIHACELNEYGLQAAYSFLGVANSAWVMRADVNLNDLAPRSSVPGANPEAGTYWLDVANSDYGVFEWNGNSASSTGGQKFANKIPLVITDSTQVDNLTGAPKKSIGAFGDYAVLAVSNLNKLFFKNRSGDWVEVGSDLWTKSWPTVVSTKIESQVTITSSDTLTINGNLVTASGTTLASFKDNINSTPGLTGIHAEIVDSKLEIYNDGTVSDHIMIANGAGTLLTAIGLSTDPYYSPALSIGPHTQVPQWKTSGTGQTPHPTGSIWIKTTNVNLGANWRVKLWNTSSESWDNIFAPLYASGHDALYHLDRTGGGLNIPTGSLYIKYNNDEQSPTVASFKIYRRTTNGATTFTSEIITASTFNSTPYTFTMGESLVGEKTLSPNPFTSISFNGLGSIDDSHNVASAINAANFKNIVASVDSQNRVVISHIKGGEIRLTDELNSPLNAMGFKPFNVSKNTGTINLYGDPQDPDPLYDGDVLVGSSWFIASNWKPLSYVANDIAPLSLPEEGRLWYSSVHDEVDIMIHNGTTWVGYLDESSPYYSSNNVLQTDPNGPIVSASIPSSQSDGSPLVKGDIWIDSSDLENYPSIHKWDADNKIWIPVDNTDQTTEDGIIFADARWAMDGGTNGELYDPASIVDLLTSNFLDFDAPDPDLYPRGIMLFNTRRSGFNVKRFVRNYVNKNDMNMRYNDESMDGYYVHRWVNESGNASNGAGVFGRKAQRKVVVKHLKATVDTSQTVRDWEKINFNLIACPGYPELISNLVNLNLDRKQTAFVIGDTPFRLANDSTTLNDWGSNANLVDDDSEEGLVTYDDYLGVYYPSGLSTDNLGNSIVVPPSHMVLRTIALSDNVSFPWFAPAGTRRGSVTNATSIGYVDAMSAEFQSIALNESQRDTLYALNINPITFFTGIGIVVFGQKTRSPTASALDRINVARLVVHLRGQLDTLAKPYIFEPNDRVTRDELKSSADSLMLELVGQRALYDFITVCDESNNTPQRIDRNELYLDIAIEPVKAVEFIYIPLRLKNTGTISGLAK